MVAPGPGRLDVPAQTSRRADGRRRARRAGRVRGAGREPDGPGHGCGRVPPGQSLAGWLYPPMWTVQLSGVIGALPLVAAAAALLRRLRLAAATLLKVWLEAVAKMVVQRDRPAETLPDVILRGPVRGPRAELSLRSCHGDLRDHRAGGLLLQRLVKGPALGAGRRGLPVTGVPRGALPRGRRRGGGPGPVHRERAEPGIRRAQRQHRRRQRITVRWSRARLRRRHRRPRPRQPARDVSSSLWAQGESVPKRPRPARLAALRGLRSTHDAAREQA